MKLPLTIATGMECIYLKDANGQYIVKSIGDDPHSLQELSLLQAVANAFPRALEDAQKQKQIGETVFALQSLRAAIFATMPDQPDDMGSLEGLTAYAEAIAIWRTQHGFPEQYHGSMGPKVNKG